MSRTNTSATEKLLILGDDSGSDDEGQLQEVSLSAHIAVKPRLGDHLSLLQSSGRHLGVPRGEAVRLFGSEQPHTAPQTGRTNIPRVEHSRDPVRRSKSSALAQSLKAKKRPRGDDEELDAYSQYQDDGFGVTSPIAPTVETSGSAVEVDSDAVTILPSAFVSSHEDPSLTAVLIQDDSATPADDILMEIVQSEMETATESSNAAVVTVVPASVAVVVESQPVASEPKKAKRSMLALAKAAASGSDAARAQTAAAAEVAALVNMNVQRSSAP